jgi:PAS domain S-box-containing protein
MWLGWGPDITFFYNDAYIPTLGIKHPAALGQPLRDVWKEVFAAVEDRIRSVMQDGVATWDEALMLLLERRGYPEETYHTFSYSPLRGDGPGVEGLMCVVTEVTERVLSERRLETLRALSAALIGVRTRADVAAGAQRALHTNEHDFPFSLVRFIDGDGDGASESSPLDRVAWPFDKIACGGVARVPLHGTVDPPKGAWDIPAREALLVPIVKPGQKTASGALVLGCNPYRPEDPEIEGFVTLLAGQIAGALANADIHLTEEAEMERLRQLFAQSPSFMAILRGETHRYELVNPVYMQLIAHRDVIGMSVREALPEVAGQGFFELLDRVYATGEPFVGQSLPITIQRTPGAAPEARKLDFVYQPILDGEGAVSGIFVQGIDVTSAHDAALALHESEESFRILAESLPNQVWAANATGELEWFNQRNYDYSGLAVGDLGGQAWLQSIHPDDRRSTIERWTAALSSGDIYETEFRLRRADGVYRWHIARAVPILGDDGVIGRWIGVNTDIDDQKTAAQALAAINTTLEAEVEAQSRERERLWQNSGDLLVVVDHGGVLQAVSPVSTALLGWTPEEMVGHSIFDFILPEDRAATYRALDKAVQGPLEQLENRYRHKEGGFRWMSWVAMPEGASVYATGRHITAQKDAAEALQRTEEQLRQAQKMEAVGQLTGGIAHDFNNLLTGITGSLEMLETRLAQGRLDAMPRYVDAAQGAAKRAASLTQRLLAFSRRQTLDPRSVNVNRLIGDMEDLIRRTTGPAIELEVVGAAGLWATLVDPNQLENALLNLCINARDAMPDGGRLTIETANKWLDDNAARDRELPPGQYISLCVTDTGIGMTPEVIARAFDPFFTTKPLGEGTGLGLSMIYGFVRQSNGQVRIYSEVGQGTTMCLYLPRHFGEANEGDVRSAIESQHYGGHDETVLVVDDEPTVRMLIVDVLRDAGYTAIEAADGPTGLTVLRSDARIDLLITDVGLPGGMNGRQVADAGRMVRPDLKVLFITGYAENAVVRNGQLDPGMAIVTKPFAIESLGNKIREMIDG